MQLSPQSTTPQAPQKPAPRGDMPSASVGGNRPPLNYEQRPGGDATMPQEGAGQGGYMGGVRANFDRNRGRR